MPAPESTSAHHAWHVPPHSHTKLIIEVLVIGVTFAVFFFFVTGVKDPNGSAPHSTPERLTISLGIGLAMMVLALVAVSLVPTQLSATAESITIRNRFGTRRIPSHQIKGVRIAPRRHDRSLVCVYPEHGRLCCIHGPLVHHHPDIAPTLLRLFGPLPEDQQWQQTASSAQAVSLAQSTATFTARPRYTAWFASDIAAAAAVIPVLIFWRQLWDALVQFNTTSELAAMTLVFLPGVIGVFGLLAICAFLRGSYVRTVTIATEGITIRRWLKTTRIPANTITGVSVRPSLQRNHPRAVLVYAGRRAWRFTENLFTAPPGLFAGVLLHRFGEQPPNEPHPTSPKRKLRTSTK